MKSHSFDKCLDLCDSVLVNNDTTITQSIYNVFQFVTATKENNNNMKSLTWMGSSGWACNREGLHPWLGGGGGGL